MAATKLVKKGETRPLGVAVDPNMPAFPPHKMMMQTVQPNQQFGRPLEGDPGWNKSGNDDVTQFWRSALCWSIWPSISFWSP